MPVEEKYQQIVQNLKLPSERPLWVKTAIFSLVIFTLLFIYIPFTRGSYDLATANKALAYTSVIFIGLSFALSGLCYFWNFADSKIVYRKHLGVTGFVYGALHGIISLFFLPENFPFPAFYFSKENIFTFLLGFTALAIFAGMAAISNRYAIHELGGQIWRRLLRFGYIALVLVLLHFGLMKFQFWRNWVNGGLKTLPSLSLVVAIIILLVLLLRLVLEISVRRKKKSLVTPATPNEIKEKSTT